MGLSTQQHKPSSGGDKCHAGTRGKLNKSSDFVKKQSLRTRTRSLDHVKASDVKDASVKSLRSNVKQSDARVGRLRSQSAERQPVENQRSSASKSRPQMKLTIPHTPQLLK